MLTAEAWPHCPLSYHHLCFKLINSPVSRSSSKARFKGSLKHN